MNGWYKYNWFIVESETFSATEIKKIPVFYVYKKLIWKWYRYQERFYKLDEAKDYIAKRRSKTSKLPWPENYKLVHYE